MFFSCPSALSTSSHNISKKEALIILKSSTKHSNSKKFGILQNVLQNVLFSSQIFLVYSN